MFHVALYQPKIPPNTGNIARQCVGMNATLHLIGADFDLSEHAVKRAGLDYWCHLRLVQHDAPQGFLDWLGDQRLWLVSKHGDLRYDQAAFAAGDVLLFGNEISGLPGEWLARWPQRAVHIPILGNVRSYNLSNAVAIVLAQACLASGAYGRPVIRNL